jgi:transcriptional regulator with XRE-family HTH domain
MAFKENLRSELSYKNMLVKELAALTGTSKSTIDNYLNIREVIPSADIAVKIANALGVTVEYLVTGDETTPVRVSHGPEIKELVQDFKLLNKDDRKMIKDIIQLFKTREKKNNDD